MDMCGVVASLLFRSYFWQDPAYFFQGPTNENFTMAQIGTFCFVTLTLAANRDQETYWTYVAQVVLTDACIGFGEPSPIFYGGGTNTNFGQHF